MKGITPVIAIILLLLITISMVGFAFVWFQRVQTTMTNSTESELQSQLSRQSQKVAIDNAEGTSLTIRNIGTSNVAISSVTAYVGGYIATLSVCSGTIAPGAVATCTLNTSCGTGIGIRVTSPGGQDATTC